MARRSVGRSSATRAFERRRFLTVVGWMAVAVASHRLEVVRSTRRPGGADRGVSPGLPAGTGVYQPAPDHEPSADAERRRVIAPAPLALFGVDIPRGATIHVRALDPRSTEPRGWVEAVPLGTSDEGPDVDTPEEYYAAWRRGSHPIWVDAATEIELAVTGASPDELDVVLIEADEELLTADATAGTAVAAASPSAAGVLRDDGGVTSGPPQMLAASVPGRRVVPRSEWGAMSSGSPSYASGADVGIVHHTVNSNAYSAAQAPGIVRAIQRFHIESNGWKDVGYNLLIDRYGTIYEGRAGGLDRAVIGAHAVGANSGSVGVAIIGDFRSASVPLAAVQALEDLLVYKFTIHRIDPTATTTANGRRVSTLCGHGDVGSTACPGGQLAGQFPSLRDHLARRVDLEPFPDVRGNVHEDQIHQVLAAGVASGYDDGTYRPRAVVSRDQMATFVARAAQLPPQQPQFTDVDPNGPHGPNIGAVAAARIAEGYRDGSYRPGNDVTRAQMATFLARARGLDDVPPDFPDVDPGNVHAGAIGAIARAGIAQGFPDGTFQPDEPVRRDQMASFLVGAFDL